MLFTIGVVGVMIKRNVISMFMCIELMLNAVNLTLVTFSRINGSLDGQIMAFFVMTVAAAEVVIGLAIGIVSAFAIGRLLTSQLYEVSAHNPALLAASTALLAAIALIACLVPARRAAQVEPIQALRAE